jgi:hypothetical protein
VFPGTFLERFEACLQAEGRHFEILLKDKVGFVYGKPAGSFSVSGPPLYGKEAAAVSETSLHIKRTPSIMIYHNHSAKNIICYFFIAFHLFTLNC